MSRQLTHAERIALEALAGLLGNRTIKPSVWRSLVGKGMVVEEADKGRITQAGRDALEQALGGNPGEKRERRR